MNIAVFKKHLSHQYY